MLFDDNDYYDHIFGPEDNNNDFNFNFDDFISNETINDNISTTPDDPTPEIDSITPNPLPPPQNSDSVAYYFEDYTQLKEYVKLYYNNVRNHYILLPVDASNRSIHTVFLIIDQYDSYWCLFKNIAIQIFLYF